MTHWAMEYIGKPWVFASDGPEAYDCWGLVVAVYRQMYGRELDIIPVEQGNLRQVIKAFKQHPERKNWVAVDNPKEGDVALMRQSRHPIHVGIWLNIDGGGVMHAMQGNGVVFQDIGSLSLSGWKIEGWYRNIH